MAVQVSVLLAEKAALRDELRHLKLCQLNYFTVSVTATGALLGLGSKFGQQPSPSTLLFVPLLIVLPCWWIFFDKASTITRLVGYMNVLDLLLSEADFDRSPFRYLAWEAALAHYRKTDQLSLGERVSAWSRGLRYGLTDVLTFQTTQRYWSINWYTYCVLSVICWLLGSNVLEHGLRSLRLTSADGLILAVIIISAVYNLYLSGSLVGGRLSYRAQTTKWKTILQADNVPKVIAALSVLV